MVLVVAAVAVTHVCDGSIFIFFAGNSRGDWELSVVSDGQTGV